MLSNSRGMELWEAFAEEAGLRYVKDSDPGFTRKRRGKGFVYLDHERGVISSETVLHRLKSLVLPPAWEDIWICRFTNGHLQATGRDARERKQYRYHMKWSELRNANKFEKLKEFGAALPTLRASVQSHLAKHGLGRERVLAAVVQVMEKTHIRVGNDIYTEENESYGLTTIENRHAKVLGSHVRFKFKGKSGVMRDVEFADKRLARIIQQCQDLPGEELFAFEDANGVVHDIASHDVNDYLREVAGHDVTAKHFRTWAGTVHAIEYLLGHEAPPDLSKTARKKREVEVIKAAAKELGNTTTVCKKYYVHPMVFEADRSGELKKILAKVKKRPLPSLSVSESVLMNLLG